MSTADVAVMEQADKAVDKGDLLGLRDCIADQNFLGEFLVEQRPWKKACLAERILETTRLGLTTDEAFCRL